MNGERSLKWGVQVFATGAILAVQRDALLWTHAVLLGVLQGLTEFLPVSSSGHLALAEAIFHLARPGLALEAGLHLGTLAAVLWVYRDDLKRWTALGHRGDRISLWILVVGTLPVAIVGWAARPIVDRLFVSLGAVGAGWILTGVILLLAAWHRAGNRTAGELRWIDGIWIGCAQALALVPGISRSGATIAAGMWRELQPVEAARFSFLLSIPAVTGAVVLELGGLWNALAGGGGWTICLAIAVALASGVAAIRYCVGVLSSGGLASFGYYCLALGVLTLLHAVVRA